MDEVEKVLKKLSDEVNDFGAWLRDFLFIANDIQVLDGFSDVSKYSRDEYVRLRKTILSINRSLTIAESLLYRNSYLDWKNVDDYGHPAKYSFGEIVFLENLSSNDNDKKVVNQAQSVINKISEIKKEYGGI